MNTEKVKLVVYVPEEYVMKIRDALHEDGYLKAGLYDHVVSWQKSNGTWRPLSGSHPFNGAEGKISVGTEARMEVRCPKNKAKKALQIIRSLHPYEEPVIDIIPLIAEEELPGK